MRFNSEAIYALSSPPSSQLQALLKPAADG